LLRQLLQKTAVLVWGGMHFVLAATAAALLLDLNHKQSFDAR
jgi:hypothetical protein